MTIAAFVAIALVAVLLTTDRQADARAPMTVQAIQQDVGDPVALPAGPAIPENHPCVLHGAPEGTGNVDWQCYYDYWYDAYLNWFYAASEGNTGLANAWEVIMDWAYGEYVTSFHIWGPNGTFDPYGLNDGGGMPADGNGNVTPLKTVRLR